MAFETSASLTSLSVIAPEAAWIILTATSLVESFINDSLNASTEPLESALNTRLSSLRFSWSNCSDNDSSEIVFLLVSESFLSLATSSTILFACCSFWITYIVSPACGTWLNPIISAGWESSTFSTLSPLSLINALTLP